MMANLSLSVRMPLSAVYIVQKIATDARYYYAWPALQLQRPGIQRCPYHDRNLAPYIFS